MLCSHTHIPDNVCPRVKVKTRITVLCSCPEGHAAKEAVDSAIFEGLIALT